MIRVFPRRTKWTPTDDLAFVGEPPLWVEGSPLQELPVFISVAFTWDIEEGKRLVRSWRRFSKDVLLNGPAFNHRGEEFDPGMFVKPGFITTSRGCMRRCGFCLVPHREGPLRELPIRDGWNLFDNNLLACSREHIEAVFEMLRRQKHPIQFTGGLDTKLLQSWHVDLLKTIRLRKMYFAADSLAGLHALERAADLLSDFPRDKKHCYVLVGFEDGDNPFLAEKRLERVFKLGFLPFSMLYRSPEVKQRTHEDKAWRKLVRIWCNPARLKGHLKGKMKGKNPDENLDIS